MQNQDQPRRPLAELLLMIDRTKTIGEIMELVKNEHIVIRMKSQQAASNIPSRPLPQIPGLSPVDSLRAQVRLAAVDMYRPKHPEQTPVEPPAPAEPAVPAAPIAPPAPAAPAAPVSTAPRRMEELLRAVDTCPSIDKLFELVKNEHIVIQMKSQHAASNIPFRPLPQKPDLTPLESLRAQVREAVIAMFKPAIQPQPDSKERLLYKVDTCQSIDKLFELVKNEHIVIQMKSQNAASNIPFRPLPQNPQISPLETLREQVRDAVNAMYESRAKERLIHAIKTCPSIDKLFELVKNEHIVIRMKSQNSASCLPQHRLSGAELTPDTTPLERLRQQVLEAVIYG